MVNVATSWSFCHGRRTAITRGGAAFGDLSGATDAYGYNLRSEVVSSRRTLDGAEVRGFDYDYAYDPIGNRTSATDYDEQGNALVSSYSANALNQYTQRTVPGYAAIRGEAATNATVTVNERPVWRINQSIGGSAAPTSARSGGNLGGEAAQTSPQSGSYFYGGDVADNTTSSVLKDLEVYAAINPSGTNTPDIVSATTGTVFIVKTPEQFTYDADGNMTSDGRFRYFWNGENRLVCASNAEVVVTYAYDHRGRMVRKDVSRTDNSPFSILHYTFVWDDWNIIREVVREGDSVAVTDNVWGLDLDGTLQGTGGVGGLLAVIRSNSNSDSNSSLYFPTYDANGNISEYVSTNGEVVAHYDYSPFGEPLVTSGPLAATFTHQFSTKPYCPVTGFSEYQMRKYNPTIGRWMNRDPIGEDGGMGLYCYASNMPICEADYIGLSIGEWGIWPWNWFNGADSCLSEFPFEDKGQEYANTMRETTLLYDTLFVTPAGNVIYHRAIKKKPDFGFTLTDFNKVGYACCCDKLGQYTPAFLLSAFTKTYILNADAAYWNDKKRRFNDPRVDLKWRGSTRHQRQKLVIRHERRHRDHAKSNFDKVKGVLRTSSQKRYGTESECFTAAKNDLDNATQEFRQLELIAANKVERGEL